MLSIDPNNLNELDREFIANKISALQQQALLLYPPLEQFAIQSAQCKDVSEYWYSHKHILPGICLANWRGYDYIRIFICAEIEVTVCYFRPGSHTDIHDHDGWNWNYLIAGELLVDIKHKVRNNHFEEIGLMAMTKTSPLGCILKPHQCHEMIAPKWTQGSISFNFHSPARPLELN
jgi:hypothetical protein